MERRCLACGDIIVGRSDKKFCSDSCRNNYHYNLNHDQVNLIRNVNNILRKNRHLLKTLNPKGKINLAKQQLVNSGFNFKYFTNIYTTKSGRVYYVVYDQAYSFSDNEAYVTIVENSNL